MADRPQAFRGKSAHSALDSSVERHASTYLAEVNGKDAFLLRYHVRPDVFLVS